MNASALQGATAGSGVEAPKSGLDSARLQQLEQLADKYYNATDAGERRQAQTALAPFSTSSECIPECQFLLDHSKQPFALLLASTSLLKLLTVFWNQFSVEQTVDMRNYLLRYLAMNCDKGLPPFVVSSLIQVVCRISKLGWKSDPKHQEICAEVTKFLEHTAQHCVVGLRILTELVDEMNHAIPGRTISTHRKVAVSFRDLSLLKVFQISVASLRQILGQPPASSDESSVRETMKAQALDLALKCLSYDYIGTNADESAEEFGALQIPSSWRGDLEDGSVLALFFDILLKSQPPHSSRCMEIIVQLASCRRSLFTREELRRNYLQCLCVASADVITSHSAIIADHDCYTHFCRLLVAMKANFQLQDLAKTEAYGTWIRAVSSFTIDSFNNWEWAGESTHYLVTLWARLTLSIPYMRGDLPTYLDSLVPRVTQAYIDTRLKACQKAMREDEHDAFFEESSLQDHLHYVPSLCRHAYSVTFTFLQSRIDPLLQRYREFVENRNASAQLPPEFMQQLAVIEAEIAWLFYVIGSIISGHISTGTSRDEQLSIDAQLSARVLSCADLLNTRQMQTQLPGSFPYLNLAILSFFQQFSRGHMGQSNFTSSIHMTETPFEPQIFPLLSAHLGPTDQASILSSMLRTIVTDLKVWLNVPRVVQECLGLLHYLATSYSTSKLIVNLDAAKTILQNHGSEFFPFMDVPANSKMRTKFYMTWGRLACSEPHIDFFDNAMESFDRTFQFLQQHQNFRSEQVRLIGIGLSRDLRGVISSTYNKVSYQMFFEWLYPKYFGQFLRLLETWWDTPTIAVPLLRFSAELVYNKTQRISFPPSSSNGIILFKEASKVLQIYGSRILASTSPVVDVYKERYKGIGICMQILQRALSGNYANFGVFVLYNDKALSNALKVVIKLMLLFPLPELLAFKKISQNYFHLMEVLFRNHIDMLTELETPVFLSLISSMLDGLSDFDTRLSSLAATAIDNFASYMYLSSKKSPPSDAFTRLQTHMRGSVDLLPQMLAMLLNLILFENVTNHWSLSRPVLSLILTMEQAFKQYEADVIRSQPTEHQQRIATAFEHLMEGVRPNLESRNRDRFTQNLVLFRNELRTFAVKPSTL